MLKDFRAFQLAKEFYQTSKFIKLPPFLKDPFTRASSSIALNLAESSGKRTDKERIRYFTIAFGSLRECQAILEIEAIRDPKVHDLADQLGAVLYRLCRFPAPHSQTSEDAKCTDDEAGRPFSEGNHTQPRNLLDPKMSCETEEDDDCFNKSRNSVLAYRKFSDAERFCRKFVASEDE
jgi:four helix bundle protein